MNRTFTRAEILAERLRNPDVVLTEEIEGEAYELKCWLYYDDIEIIHEGGEDVEAYIEANRARIETEAINKYKQAA